MRIRQRFTQKDLNLRKENLDYFLHSHFNVIELMGVNAVGARSKLVK